MISQKRKFIGEMIFGEKKWIVQRVESKNIIESDFIRSYLDMNTGVN